ncbi:hypothetical protein Glove_510g18 [Diversispora epigaea]|uniref:Uncharacterized protein n=1 Tax=Diversispora epigaea TaxID=1348612 RepID=A0A397GFQ0_9GLOM|nr:hypothetical protein Glove_510g18 [Diversispora epigaea]
MTNIQSKIDLLKQRAIDLEAENAKLKQIIKENAKRKADNVNLSAENVKVKIELRRAMGENAKLKAESLREEIVSRSEDALHLNISASYITMTNIQSKIDLLKQRAIDLEAENAKLKQIIKENAKRKADNVNLSAENVKVKIELRRAMGENAKLKAESLREVKTRERIEKTMLNLDGCLYRKSLSRK